MNYSANYYHRTQDGGRPATYRTYDAALADATAIHGPAWHNSMRIQQRPATPTSTTTVYVLVPRAPAFMPLL